MKRCKFITRLVELNEYLKEFPPFRASQEIPDEELLDTAEYSSPAVWQKNMVWQNFNPMAHIVQEFIKFFKCLEIYKDNTNQQDNEGLKS